MSDGLILREFADALRGCAADPPPDAGTDGDTWLARLPRLVEAALARWELRRDDAAVRHGVGALVVPVRRAGGQAAALKLTWPHPQARHEHLALRAWAGVGAVRLLAAYPADDALLLERLDADHELTGEPIEAACAVVGALLATLDRPALPQLDRLSDWVRGFLADTADPDPRLPRRFVEQARALAADLAGEDLDQRLVHTDLHDANVLWRPDPGEWVAIDPKPMAAQPAFALWPMLHNRWAEAIDGDLRWNTHCRLGRLADAADAAGVEEERARAWAIIRTVADAGRLLSTGGPADTVSARIRLLKALQPD